ncbi:hypothetical protein NJ76_11100 [Rhodococcus sp. IITR03]|nr:hypothetical protein NJ76_11100 [Rhodococcus sp. IITR03]
MLVVQDDGAVDLRHAGDQVQTTVRGEGGTGAETDRRVVVAGGGDDDRPCLTDGLETGVAHGHRVGTRDRPVVHVARHDHHVDPAFGHQIGDGPQRTRLVGEQVDTVEGAADVPVGGVQDPHGTDGRGGDRHPRVSGGCRIDQASSAT